MKNSKKIIIGILASSLVMATGAAEARSGVIKARGANGGVTAAKGPNGGSAVRARGTRQNTDGSVTRASGGAYRTPNGGTSVRGSNTTVNPDGSAARNSGYAASGARGSVNSDSAVARDANGNWSGGRTTSATNATTGNSYQGSTTIDPATGKPVHSGSCADASGAVIACPR
ncbi:MAG: hypothetical protein V7676_01015 [Parasphingorhabdus sp.]|uniref:hypothetical protein n=1 Tax=Parasphingorhabdus sp. TaxID=2709688 RepID=UPI00300322EA